MMRVGLPLLCVLIVLSLLLQLLHFVFVVHFQDVVASVVIIVVIAGISFCVSKWLNRRR